LPIYNLLLVRFENSEILKAELVIERAVDANNRRIRDEAQQSDARICEKLQNTAEEHDLVIGPQDYRADEELRTTSYRSAA
jgi:hypothetical protein